MNSRNTFLSRLSQSTLLGALCLASSACSLLINPNEARLSGDGARPDVQGMTVDQPNVVPDANEEMDVQEFDQVDPPDVVVEVDVPTPRDVPTVDVASHCIAGCNDGVACTDDICNEATGTCNFVPNAGRCAMGQVCNPAMGGCVVQNCMNEAQCNDGNMCNGRETCNMGVCQPGTPLRCDDGNMCNGAETCNAATGCAAGTPLRCDDGLFCNGQESCDNRLGCVQGPPIPCDDGIACTTDSCNEMTDRCDNVANPMACPMGQVCSIPMRRCIMQGCQNAGQCSDGNVCNGIEQCNGGMCVPGTPMNCNDNNMCNGTETCDRVMGCQMGMPLRCDDGQFCNGTETCSPASGCQRGALPVCNDNNVCTNDFCSMMANGGAGGCVATLVDADGDGAPAQMVNGVACNLGTDCNDAVAAIRPGAMEICNNMDDNCNNMVDEGLVCGAPANDTCATSQVIALTMLAPTVTVRGTTALAMDNIATTCSMGGAGGGGDVFYTITYPAGFDLRVEATPIGGGDPVMGIRTDCGGATLGCNDDQRNGVLAPRMWVRDDGRNPGVARRVIVMVDAFQRGNEGAFNLTATITTAAPYGACRPGSLDVSAGGTVLANPPLMMGSQSASCSPGGFMPLGEDSYFYNNAAMGARLTLTATFRPMMSTRDPAMCGNQGSERNCTAGGGPGQLQINAMQTSNVILVDGIAQPGAPAGTPTFYSLEVRPN